MISFINLCGSLKGSLSLKVRTSPFQGEGVGFKSRRDHCDVGAFG